MAEVEAEEAEKARAEQEEEDEDEEEESAIHLRPDDAAHEAAAKVSASQSYLSTFIEVLLSSLFPSG